MRLGLETRHVVIGAGLAAAIGWALMPASEGSIRRDRLRAEQARSAALQDLMTDEEQSAWRRYKSGPSLPASATAGEHYQRAQRAYGSRP